MDIRTFDEYCELDTREQSGIRFGSLSGRPIDEGEEECPGFDWIDESETRGFEKVDDLIRSACELETIL